MVESKNKAEDNKKEGAGTTQTTFSSQSSYSQGGRRKGRFFARKKVDDAESWRIFGQIDDFGF